MSMYERINGQGHLQGVTTGKVTGPKRNLLKGGDQMTKDEKGKKGCGWKSSLSLTKGCPWRELSQNDLDQLDWGQLERLEGVKSNFEVVKRKGKEEFIIKFVPGAQTIYMAVRKKTQLEAGP